MVNVESIKRSSLWAAYGDALGFITELSNESTLNYRTHGQSKVTKLIPWVRRIGGQFGISLDLPQGCYSDDTQLRLSTSRSIRGDGTFDVETFSKVELPVWLSYALGAGTGTKSAAMNLTKRQVQWNTNFYSSNFSNYVQSGGNGAPMRIQPHVWCSPKSKSNSEMLRDVLRNTLTTHGHCRAFVGSAFHALVLRQTILNHTIPEPTQWNSLLSDIKAIPKIITSDEPLRMYWVKNWEHESKMSLEEGINQSVEELQNDIRLIIDDTRMHTISFSSEGYYQDIANKLGCYNEKTRGSATITALISAYASYIFKDNIHHGLTIISNALGTDTDTIATMAGAIMGVVAKTEPPEELMDQVYINKESERLFNISQGNKDSSFAYPDLLYWQPPFSQNKALGKLNDKWTLKGFGEVFPTSSEFTKNDKNPTIWQWFRLQFGQTVLLKRSDKVDIIPEKMLPVKQQDRKSTIKSIPNYQRANNRLKTSQGLQTAKQPSLFNDENNKEAPISKDLTVEKAADMVVKYRFKFTVIGSLLLELAGQENGEEKASSFAKLIAKARNARLQP